VNQFINLNRFQRALKREGTRERERERTLKQHIIHIDNNTENKIRLICLESFTPSLAYMEKNGVIALSFNVKY